MKCVDPKFSYLRVDDPSSHLNFKKFESIPTLSNYNFATIGTSTDVFNEYDNLVYMFWEEPNCFWVPTVEQTIKANYNKIYKLISSCPYTTDYFNRMYGNEKRMWAFTPFNIENIPTDFTKIYDVFFTGHVFHDFITGYVKVIEKFNHCVVGFNYGNFAGVSYKKKIELNGNSRISVVHNCLYDTSGLPMNETYAGNEVFKNIKKNRFMPQIKLRTLEAAACKSVILSHFEEFKTIETYFTPDIDFIYWYDLKDLEEKIHEILKNYDKYYVLAENAHQKLINHWTTYHFFDKYLRNL